MARAALRRDGRAKQLEDSGKGYVNEREWVKARERVKGTGRTWVDPSQTCLPQDSMRSWIVIAGAWEERCLGLGCGGGRKGGDPARAL